MKIPGNFVGISLYCLLLASCGGDGGKGTCGGEDPKPVNYSITQYDASLVVYPQPIDDQTLLQNAKPLVANQVIDWKAFSIEINAKWQMYTSFHWPQVSLFEQAMACSPAEHVMQTLTQISITSAHHFSDKYPAGSELAPLFGEIMMRGAVTRLNGGDAPRYLQLKLLEAPQYASQNFEIQMTLSDGKVYILKTGDVYFKIP